MVSVLEARVCSYYMETAGGKTLTEQSGVFRTNCIDCLDRTNVVQSLIARKNLQDVFEVATLTLEKHSCFKALELT